MNQKISQLELFKNSFVYTIFPYDRMSDIKMNITDVIAHYIASLDLESDPLDYVKEILTDPDIIIDWLDCKKPQLANLIYNQIDSTSVFRAPTNWNYKRISNLNSERVIFYIAEE